MPTSLPRHVITETDAVRLAIDAGRRKWPELSRGRVAARLVEEAGRALDERQSELARRRREALREPPPEIGRWFPVGALEELREDWDA